MSLIITDECIACDACREECPNYAIEEGDPIYVIDSDRCTECVGHYGGASGIEGWPGDCIRIGPDKQETREELKFK